MSKFDAYATSMHTRTRAKYPSVLWVLQAPNRFIAFGLGSGLIRPGSGTWGTLLAWIIWHIAAPWISHSVMGGLLVLAFLYGCWACDRVGKALQQPDHLGIVWDEMVAFWLLLWLTPPSLLAQSVAFVLFRTFDILKPPPIKYFDAHLKGGFGVMWDDILAATYALLLIALIAHSGGFG
jgi:phosphatidylglycerophosphatase A